MNQDAENKQCQICHGYLFEDDDVVVCPECGAPHHRDCWHSLGHCGVEADHGTENEYSKRIAREKAQAESQSRTDDCNSGERRICKSCGKESRSKGARFCPYCGTPFDVAKGNGNLFGEGPISFRNISFEIDPCGGIPKDTKIEDCKASDLAKFVGSNSHRYIPKFATLNKTQKASWNWAAFLFPSVWCFARKMNLKGTLFFILTLASNLCFLSFNSTFSSIFDTTDMTTTEIYKLVYQNIGELNWLAIALMLVGFVLNIISRIVAGRYADWMYRGFAIDSVKRITNDPEVDDVEEELMHKGNISLLFMFLALLAEQYLPSIIGMFIL